MKRPAQFQGTLNRFAEMLIGMTFRHRSFRYDWK
jgi:hypothetical protein